MQPVKPTTNPAGGAFTGAQNYLPEKPAEQVQSRTAYPLPVGMGLKPGALATKATIRTMVRIVRPTSQPDVFWIFGGAGRAADTRPRSMLQVEVNDPLGASQQAARELIAQLLSMQADVGVLGVLDFEPMGNGTTDRLVLQIETPSELVSIAPPGLEDLQIGHDEQSTHYPRALWAAVWWVYGLHQLASRYKLQVKPGEIPEWEACPDGWLLRTETGGSGPAEGDTSMLAIFASEVNARELEADHPERRWRLVTSSWLPDPSTSEPASTDPWTALSAACRAVGMNWAGPEKVRDVSHG